MALTREGAGVLSTIQRHLAFLDSELVAAAVADSTFDVKDLLRRPTSLFVQVSPDQLEAQRGLIRCWLSTLIRAIGSIGDERRANVLCLFDEASALNGLAAVEEALVRGRSAGIRLLLAYQSDSLIRTAFKDKPTLLYDNCSTQIYLAPSAGGIETGERLSKILGDFTQVVESASESNSRSHQDGWSTGNGAGSVNVSRSWSRNWQPQGRALARPEELLTMSRELLIALVDGLPPIRARRIKYYRDPLFQGGGPADRGSSLLWWLLLAGAAVLTLWAVMGGQ